MLGLWDLNQEGPPAIAAEAEQPTPFFSPDGTELFVFWNPGHARWRIQSASSPGTPPTLTRLPMLKAGRILSGQFTSNSLILGTAKGVLIFPRTDVETDGVRTPYPKIGVYGQASPNGLWLAARYARAVVAYRVEPWEQLKIWESDTELLAHAFTPGSDELAVLRPGGVTFLDTNRWEPRRNLSEPIDKNTHLIFTPTGDAFWLAHDGGTAALHDMQTFKTLLQLPGGMVPLAISRNGRHLAVSVDAARLQVWDLTLVRKQLGELGLDWK